MHTAQGHAARSRRPLDIEGTQRAIGQVPPHKERALWNFLTWSFFIAQILAADQLAGGQAKAAGDLDLPTSDANAETVAPLSDSVMLVEGAGDAGREEAASVRSTGLSDDGVTALMKYGQFDGSAIALDAVPAAQSEDATQVEIISGGNGLAASEQVPADYVTPSIANDIHGGLLDVVNDTVDPLLDTVEDIVDALGDIVGDITDPLLGTLDDIVESTVDPLLNTVESVVASLDDILGGVTDPLLGVLGDVVPDLVANIGDNLGDVIEGTVDPLLNATGAIVGSLDDILGGVTGPLLGTLGDAVPDLMAAAGNGLGNVIEESVQPLKAALEMPTKALDALAPFVATTFEVTEAATDALDDALASAGELTFPILEIVGLDDLFSGGRYTDYNLALQANPPLVAESSDAATFSSNPIADVLAALSGVGDAEPLGNAEDGLHLPHIAIPGILEEIALRGLGDGIV